MYNKHKHIVLFAKLSSLYGMCTFYFLGLSTKYFKSRNVEHKIDVCLSVITQKTSEQILMRLSLRVIL